MKKISVALGLWLLVSSVATAQVIWVRTTMAGKPTCEAGIKGRVFEISDATTESDCSVGGATGNSRKMALCWCVWTAGTSAYEWQAIARGTAGDTTPGGSDTQVQYNDSGSFGGDAGLTFNETTNVLTATGGFVGAVTGNASTATALAANGANCSAGNYPLGVDASGAVESCTAAPTGTVGGSLGSTDNVVPRTSGTGGATLEGTGVSIDDNGRVTVPDGTSSGFFFGDGNAGFYEAANNQPTVRTNGVDRVDVLSDGTVRFLTAGISIAAVGSDARIGASSQNIYFGGGNGSGLIGEGSAGAAHQVAWFSGDFASSGVYRGWRAYRSVRVKAVDYTLAESDTSQVVTNEGATSKPIWTLPAAQQGRSYTAYVQDSDGLRVLAGSGDTVRIAADVSGAAGYCESTTVGDSATWVAINGDEWVAVSVVGIGWSCT